MRYGTILVTDSDTTVAACIAEVLTTEGYTVHCHPGNHLTADVIERMRPDLVVIEQGRGYPDVTLLLDQLQRSSATKSIAMIVSTTDPRMPRELAAPLRQRGIALLLKPFDLDQLLDSVAQALGDSGRQRCTPEQEQRYA